MIDFLSHVLRYFFRLIDTFIGLCSQTYGLRVGNSHIIFASGPKSGPDSPYSQHFGGLRRKCIDMDKKCDGRADCILRDDEADCSVKCHDTEFKCEKSNRCIDRTQQCDGVLDCVYGEDELGTVVH